MIYLHVSVACGSGSRPLVPPLVDILATTLATALSILNAITEHASLFKAEASIAAMHRGVAGLSGESQTLSHGCRSPAQRRAFVVLEKLDHKYV